SFVEVAVGVVVVVGSGRVSTCVYISSGEFFLNFRQNFSVGVVLNGEFCLHVFPANGHGRLASAEVRKPNGKVLFGFGKFLGLYVETKYIVCGIVGVSSPRVSILAEDNRPLIWVWNGKQPVGTCCYF